jgi:hypothetical protein
VFLLRSGQNSQNINGPYLALGGLADQLTYNKGSGDTSIVNNKQYDFGTALTGNGYLQGVRTFAYGDETNFSSGAVSSIVNCTLNTRLVSHTGGAHAPLFVWGNSLTATVGTY